MSGCVLQAFPDLNFMRNHFTDLEMSALRLSAEGYADTVSYLSDFRVQAFALYILRFPLNFYKISPNTFYSLKFLNFL